MFAADVLHWSNWSWPNWAVFKATSSPVNCAIVTYAAQYWKLPNIPLKQCTTKLSWKPVAAEFNITTCSTIMCRKQVWVELHNTLYLLITVILDNVYSSSGTSVFWMLLPPWSHMPHNAVSHLLEGVIFTWKSPQDINNQGNNIRNHASLASWPPKTLTIKCNKLALRVHKVRDDWVVYQVVLRIIVCFIIVHPITCCGRLGLQHEFYT